MKKIAVLFGSALVLQTLVACGGPMPMPMGMHAPQMMQAAPPQMVRAQSISGINKEINAAVEATFARKDANADKTITPNEFPVTTPGEFQHFRNLDADRDGKLTLKEMAPGLISKIMDVTQLKATASFLFDQLDTNGDSKLTKDEAAASHLPGVAANFDKYLTKPWYARNPLDYLRKTDFENLVAFAMLNPPAGAQ